jgi:hypothetical protein
LQRLKIQDLFVKYIYYIFIQSFSFDRITILNAAFMACTKLLLRKDTSLVQMPITSPTSHSTHRYVVQTQLGQGGMGVVYSVYDRLTQTQVALKKVSIPGLDSEFALALALEFRTLAGLRHPNIVAVLDYGFDE